MINTGLKLIVLASCILLAAAGCREEVISPNNPAGNVNEPVKSSNRNNYTFIINAENLSIDITDHTQLVSNGSRVYFFISDYLSGSVEVSLRNQNSVVFYNDKISNNLNGQYIEVRNNHASAIRIKCSDFTGKLKIQLSGI